MDKKSEIIIRSARAEDIDEVVEKIRELARFEKMEDQCKMTSEKLLKDGGFQSTGDRKYYELLVAECQIDNKLQLIGYAMWFYVSYSLRLKGDYKMKLHYFLLPNNRLGHHGKVK